MRGIERKASSVRYWEWTLKRDATTQCGSRRQPKGCAWLLAYVCCKIVILGGWSVPLFSLSLVDRFLSALPVHALLSTSCSPTPASMSYKYSLAIQTSLSLVLPRMSWRHITWDPTAASCTAWIIWSKTLTGCLNDWKLCKDGATSSSISPDRYARGNSGNVRV